MIDLPLNKQITLKFNTQSITDEGRLAVLKILRDTYMTTFSLVPDSGLVWQWDWVVSSGDYQGTLPKRISKWAFKCNGVKIKQEVLEQIGNVAKQHIAKDEKWTIDFTKEFDWEAGDFGDHDSCFWESRSEARVWLKNVGAYAIRRWLYDDEEDKMRGVGRAWMITHPTLPDCFVMFNGYGNPADRRVDYKYGPSQTRDFARVLAHHLGTGFSYKDLRLSIDGAWNDIVWINNEGYSSALIGPSAFIKEVPFRLDLKYPEHSIYVYCTHCGQRFRRSMAGSIHEPFLQEDGTYICADCRDRLVQCPLCTIGVHRPGYASPLELVGWTIPQYLCQQHYDEVRRNRRFFECYGAGCYTVYELTTEEYNRLVNRTTSFSQCPEAYCSRHRARLFPNQQPAGTQ